MIVSVLVLLLLLLLPVSAAAQGPRLHEPEQPRPWAVYFSVDDGAQAVVEALGRARKSVHVHALTVSAPQITRALVEAHQRGVRVEIILAGKSTKARAPAVASLTRAGIAVLTDRIHAAGSSVMVIDEQVVLTGSLSFAPSADGQSAESLLVINDHALAARYDENWQAHAAHSVRSSVP